MKNAKCILYAVYRQSNEPFLENNKPDLYHNYDLVIEKQSLDKSRAPSWSKIPLLLRELKNNPKIELIVWIDDDILITNKQLKFHEIIQEYSFEHRAPSCSNIN